MKKASKNYKYIKEILHKYYSQNFELIKIISDNNFSGSFFVKNNKLSKRYEIIKYIKSVEPNTIKNFEKEKFFLSIINNPNIPKIYDCITYKDIIIFRIEYIESISLEKLINIFNQKKEKIPPFIVSNIILKLSKILFYTHNEIKHNNKKINIIHCDIKPSNILISTKNFNYRIENIEQFTKKILNNQIEIYIIDFGISKLKNDKNNNFEGTLDYMSKWQLENKKLNWKTDLYQLNILYLELLYNKNPFKDYKYKEIIKLKKQNKISIPQTISKNQKKIIEKGTFTNKEKSYKLEKDFIKDVNNLYKKEKLTYKISQNKQIIKKVSIILLFLIILYQGFFIYDSSFNSVNALVETVETKDNITIKDLEFKLKKIQKRAFDKKYLNFLQQSTFDLKNNNTLMYPSYLNKDDNWILVNSDSDSSGAFVGLLFENSQNDSKILNLAKEYVDDILKSKNQNTEETRYSYSLISAYKYTNNKIYLNKLKNIANKIILGFKQREGMIQIRDIYHYELFLFLYNQTQNKTYLDVYESQVQKFIKYNINNDGYIYESSIINLSTPIGFIKEDKTNMVIINFENYIIGNHISKNMSKIQNFENKTSLFTRDFAIVLLALNSLYETTNNTLYKNTTDNIFNFYIKHNSINQTDFLFVYRGNTTDIPIDNLATIRMVQFLKDYNQTLYKEKLKALLSKKNFNFKHENGILINNVQINGINYQHSNQDLINQTLVIADREFLKI